MTFRLDEARAHLARTPGLLDAWLRDLPEPWTTADEGPETFSPYDVVGHLVHGERCDWIPRARMILEQGESSTFPPFDRFAQERESEGKSMNDLLDEFSDLRAKSIVDLIALGVDEQKLGRRGTHPKFGSVTLEQLLSTWVVHDLSHVAQVARTMSRRYREDVGPWIEYIPILAAKKPL